MLKQVSPAEASSEANPGMFVYILSNHTNTVLYTGVTNNLERRIWEHKRGLIASAFTRKYKLYKLVWFDESENAVDAIGIQKKIKGWRREKKLDLIKQKNPEFKDLSRCA